MAELEIHTDSGHTSDPSGQRVGLLAASLAVALGIVTIASHRTHTRAVVVRAEANDQWQYHQSRRIKYHILELGEDLIALLSSQNAGAQRVIQRYEKEKARYQAECKETEERARKKEEEVERAERRALRYDVGEGFLEIGLVVTSLYFLSGKKLFPGMGAVAGIIGVAIAASGLMIV